MQTTEKPILIVDGQNNFIRAYCVCPDMSATGMPAGGTCGFLKSLQKLVNQYIPKQIIICWEGGGSLRRRAIFKEYKQNRKPLKLNRFYEDDIPDSEENKTQQLLSLIKVLKTLPVCNIYVSDCEADDVIAYICNTKLKHEKKVIASSDKDFYQLLNENTTIYSSAKKRIFNKQDLLTEFKIHPNNFALAKSICGDTSDNISGIRGAGFKTIIKRFPQFMEEKELSINDLIFFCSEEIKPLSVHKNILENKDILERNMKLIDLSTNQMLSANQMNKIDYLIDTFEPRLNKMDLIKTVIQEGLKTVDPERVSYALIGLLK